MSDPVVKEFKITVTLDPQSNSFSSSFQPSPGAGPEYLWELLKTAVIAMTKSAPYFSDPVVRETVGDAAKAMLLVAAGADQHLEKAAVQRQNMLKEFRG